MFIKAYGVQGTVLSTGDAKMTDTWSLPQGPYSLGQEADLPCRSDFRSAWETCCDRAMNRVEHTWGGVVKKNPKQNQTYKYKEQTDGCGELAAGN